MSIWANNIFGNGTGRSIINGVSNRLLAGGGASAAAGGMLGGILPLSGYDPNTLMAGPGGFSSGNDFLTFNGRQIAWHDNSGNVLHTFNAVSGAKNYQNSKYTTLSNRGPIPAGGYTINLSYDPSRFASYDKSGNLYEGFGIERIPQGFLDSNPWGSIRARITPMKGTNTYGRSRFYIHDSTKGYTRGCIEVDSRFFIHLLEYGKTSSTINLYVNY